MNDSNQPQGPQVEFTQKALDAKFSYSFTRKQLICLFNTLSPIQLPVGDMRSRVLSEVLEEIRTTAISSITENDYVKPETPAVDTVKTN